ncbi:antibiotic biosynthesis monooxygenase family protein [Sulfitobacter porphyrae]|uniref:Antibiotic biosynthesis monooxygenase family protein n=1 Tax=Sulfitobacter porphyrae TaxID=1246864 RepID=A0ABW2B549_9RHOB
MNRFTVPSENAEAFEALWLGRDSHLKEMEGFVEFHMLRGPEKDGKVLFASHTVWASEDAFRNWTRSDAFRASHKSAAPRQSCMRVLRCSKGFRRSSISPDLIAPATLALCLPPLHIQGYEFLTGRTGDAYHQAAFRGGQHRRGGHGRDWPRAAGCTCAD